MNPSSDHKSGEDAEHYFSADPTSSGQRHTFTIPGLSGDLVMEAESGVFSQHGLDKGTAVLLHHMDRFGHPSLPPAGTILDLGCGSGPIALTLASHHPDCTVVAVDVNERARRLCRENAERNRLENVHVLAPEEVDDDVRFDLIWSNPPIRVGKDELHGMLSKWLSRLSDDGRAHLVVSKNLGADSLVTWLQQSGFVATKLASSKGFRIVEVSVVAQ